jgi:hypothetical protein
MDNKKLSLFITIFQKIIFVDTLYLLNQKSLNIRYYRSLGEGPGNEGPGNYQSCSAAVNGPDCRVVIYVGCKQYIILNCLFMVPSNEPGKVFNMLPKIHLVKYSEIQIVKYV